MSDYRAFLDGEVPPRPDARPDGMSYDANQRDAYRVRCIRCMRWWDMTRFARLICVECRRKC